MKPLLIATAVVAIAAVAWVLWPGDPAPQQPTPSAAERESAGRRSLAQQLEDAEHSVAGSEAERGSVAGLVTDEAGTPVAGAEVTFARAAAAPLLEATCPVCSQPILDCGDLHTAREVIEAARAGKGRPAQLGTTTSGPDGTFRLDDLPRQELILTARRPGLVARVHYESGDEPVLALAPPSAVLVKTGRLEQEVETPLPGARVTAVSRDSLRVLEGFSDASGLLRLDGLDEGDGIWVLVEAAGLSPRVATVYAGDEETQIWLEPLRALVVRTTVGGRPVEATVTLKGGTQHPASQETHGGQARFEALGSEGYDVTATSGSMVALGSGVILEQAVTTLELELKAAARVSVTVVDEAGEPVADAEVSANNQGGQYFSATASGGALVELGPMGAEPITVEVTTGDFRPWRRELDLHPGENPLEVVLKKGVKVTGRVVDSDGQGAALAEVSSSPSVGAPSVATTEADGSFELVFDDPGPQELTAALSAVGKTTLTVTAPATGVVLRLEPRARLRVFVHDGPAPFEGAAVILASDSADADAVSGGDGVAILSGLPAGKYVVAVQSVGFRQPPGVKVELVEGRTVSLDFALDRGASASGVVVDARGAPVAGADVQTQPWSVSAATDDEGRFTLGTLDPSLPYEVFASTDSLHSAPVAFQGPQSALRLVLAARPVASGRVVDGLTGNALTQFEVDARPLESPDGRFSVPLSAGVGDDVFLTVAASGFETFSWQGKVEAALELGTVRLGKAKQIEGVVKDGKGNPVSGASVTCGSADEVTSAADGTFRLELPEYDPEALVGAVRGQHKGQARLELGRLIQVTLTPPTRVQGLVVDSSGRPAATAVRINDPQGSDEVEVEAGADGAFVAELAPGRWLFTTRLSRTPQSFLVAGASTRIQLGEPPGSCALTIEAALPPDELVLVPGEASPSVDTPLEVLASIEGAQVVDTSGRRRLARAAGFRCGSYTLVGRWVALQRVQRVEVRPGGGEVQLAVPKELEGLADRLH